jgi:glycosyltransferase involved in cell wall biosynthesis
MLGRVLGAFARLIPPPCGWHLVVVDNGSTDETPGVLAAYAGRMALTVLSEPRPGKFRALNRAIPHLSGELTVVTDDDVLPEPDWLVRLALAAERQTRANLFGGTILPEWPEPPPSWLRPDAVDFGVLYALLRRPAGACDHGGIYGPNMAVRSSVFAAGARFDESIGPNADDPRYPMGGETEFVVRLRQAGHVAWFVPEACVRHIVRREQLTEAWILQRAWRNGLGTGVSYPPDWVLASMAGGGGLARRMAVARAGSVLARGLPASALRLRLLYRERWLAGMAEAVRRRAPGRVPVLSGPALAAAHER